ncbi:MAG TPA: hypothetical protein VIN75_11640 [Burkholderiaceae bacterium]
MTPARPLLRLLPAAFLLAAATSAHAAEPLLQHDVVLLEKGEVIEQRVDGGSDAMAAYVKTLGEALTDTMRAHPSQLPVAGFIVVAVRPEGRTHTWFDFKPALADATAAALAQAVATTPAMKVRSREVVFALRVSLWSNKPPKAYAPAPQEWKDATQGMHPKPDVDTLVDMVWPR